MYILITIYTSEHLWSTHMPKTLNTSKHVQIRCKTVNTPLNPSLTKLFSEVISRPTCLFVQKHGSSEAVIID